MGVIPIGTPDSSEQGNQNSIPIPDSIPTDPVVLTESNVDSDGNPVTIPESTPSDPVVLTEESTSSSPPIPVPDSLPSDPLVLTDPTIAEDGSPVTIPTSLPSDPIVLTDPTIAEDGSPVTIPESLPIDPTVLIDGIIPPVTKTDGFTIGAAQHIPYVNGNRDDFAYDPDFTYFAATDTLRVVNITLTGTASLANLLMGGVTVDTIETILTNDDAHLPTSGAVYDAIAAITHGNHTGQVTSSGLVTSLHISAITGQSALTIGLLSTDELLVNDGGALARMDVSVLQAYMQANLTFGSYVHPNHSGQVSSVGDGAMSLELAAITDQTALTSGLGSTSELLVNHSSSLRRMDISVLEAYMQANLSFGSGVTDHGALSGLSDDDHPQYYNAARLTAWANAWTGSTSITTVGTISTGTWETMIAEAYTLPAQATHSGEFLTTDGTNTSWASVAYSWFIVDGVYSREVINADEIEFDGDGTYIQVTYDGYVAGVHTMTFAYVGPTSFYSGSDPAADSGSPTRVGSEHDVMLARGSYITSSYNFSSGPPPTHTITFDFDDASYRTHLASYFYDFATYPSLATQSWVTSNFDNYVSWGIVDGIYTRDVISGDSIDFTTTTPTYIQVQYGSYVGTVHTIEIDYIGPTTFYAGWDLLADAGSGFTRVGSEHDVDLAGGSNITTTYGFVAGSPAVHTVTIALDSAISLASVTTTTGVYSDNIYERTGSAGVNVDGVTFLDGAIYANGASTLGSSAGDVMLQYENDYSVGSGNNIYHRIWAYRESAGSDYTTAVLHDALSVDSSYGTPGTDTRCWYERDPYSQHHRFGHGSTEYLRISTSYVTGYKPIRVDEGAGYQSMLYDEQLQFNRASTNYVRATSSGGQLHFVTNGLALSTANALISLNTTQVILRYGSSAPTAEKLATESYGVSVTGDLRSDGEVESYDTSDITLKKILDNLDPIEVTNALMQLRTIRYFQIEKEKIELGLIAQEVRVSFPENVKAKPDGKLMIHYGKMIAPILTMNQYQERRIVDHEERITKLEKAVF